MSKVICERDDLVAVADEVRDLQGITGGITLNGIASNLQVTNNDINTAADLIAEIAEALEGKAAGAAPVETCTVAVDAPLLRSPCNFFLIYTTVEDGKVCNKHEEIEAYTVMYPYTVTAISDTYITLYMDYCVDEVHISTSTHMTDMYLDPQMLVISRLNTGHDEFTIAIEYEDCCFIAGTQVQTSLEGETAPIETLAIGDDIVAYNIKTGENYSAKVKNTIINRNTTDIAEVYCDNGSVLTMNAYHPVYTKYGFHSITMFNGYDELVVGDVVRTMDGWTTVVDIKRYETDPIITYNLDVIDFDETIDDEANDTFFANGIVVHNAGCKY